ncbi:efflux RND transporter periplasmic adaptor subunit [Mariniblastus fucicola]|uniref:Putative efflux pump membrane fusion protein n=1 Tax=Mariniblastus fucicola TaxID=980251 RepID=A0A5B9PP55_9BACT|nr:HlyD family efflux transporter periplasmic adaptor subunit [Mariniblastus fucicola]QEG24331.1 putative efflux pump membrane fusion protein [Mariniblastus fucicola]
MKPVFTIPFIIVVAAAASCANAQMHEGRITRSFTEPIEKCVAASAESGIVAGAHVREGDRVRIGDALASINHNVLKESLAIAVAKAESTARLDAAKSQLSLIESQLDAVTSLVSGGHTNKYEVQQKTAEQQQAVAELRAAEDELNLAALEVNRIKAQIEDRIIKSPINGFVTEIHKQPGENVSHNEPQFATIVRVDQLKVRFYLDAATLRNSKVGDRVPLEVGTNGKSTQGIISFVSPVIDPDSGLGRLDVVLENSDLSIQSGIACYWKSETASVADRSAKLR